MSSQEIIERNMREAYAEQSAGLLRDANEGRFDKSGPRRVGLEVEYSVVDKDNKPVSQKERDSLLEVGNGWLQPELGAAQIELTTDPIEVNGDGFRRVLDSLTCRESLLKVAASEGGLEIVRSGTNPTLKIAEIERTIDPNKPKYRLVPEYYNQRRTLKDAEIGSRERVEISDLSVVSALNSVQLNLEALNSEDAIDLLNRSLMLSPLMTAISGNSRYLEGMNTGMSDLRIQAWSMAVDLRTEEERWKERETRVGIPDQYYSSLDDYLVRILRFPFIYESNYAVQQGVGMNWKDGKLKPIGDSLVVEFRPMAVQPTSEEDLACNLLYLGRLIWSQQNQEELLPMHLVKANKVEAMRLGMNANIWVLNGRLRNHSVKEILFDEIQKAEEGLEALEVSKEMIDLMYFKMDRRIDAGNPSDRLYRLVSQAESEGATREEAVWNGIRVLQNGLR